MGRRLLSSTSWVIAAVVNITVIAVALLSVPVRRWGTKEAELRNATAEQLLVTPIGAARDRRAPLPIYDRRINLFPVFAAQRARIALAPKESLWIAYSVDEYRFAELVIERRGKLRMIASPDPRRFWGSDGPVGSGPVVIWEQGTAVSPASLQAYREALSPLGGTWAALAWFVLPFLSLPFVVLSYWRSKVAARSAQQRSA